MLSALQRALESDAAILVAYVFGSRARGEHADGSDIDVAVYAAGEIDLARRAAMIEELERAIAYRCRVELVDLRTAPPVLAADVVREGRVIVDRDPEVRFELEIAAIRRFEDTRPLRRVQRELLREASRGPA